MKEHLKNIQWKNNLIITAVAALATFIYYAICDIADSKRLQITPLGLLQSLRALINSLQLTQSQKFQDLIGG